MCLTGASLDMLPGGRNGGAWSMSHENGRRKMCCIECVFVMNSCFGLRFLDVAQVCMYVHVGVCVYVRGCVCLRAMAASSRTSRI